MTRIIFFFAACLLTPILFALRAPASSTIPASATAPFIFVSMGDAQEATTNFTTTVNQIATLQPDLVFFNGDLEIDGVRSTEMNPMVTVIKNAGLFNQTFLVRGNHDNHVSGSAALWENYFETYPNIKILPDGVTDYVSLDSSSDYLNYSFIYGNAMFISLDVPGNIENNLTSAELTFLDDRLTFAESEGLFHAFIFFHGPLYCVESSWCACSARTNASCTPSTLVSVLNKHPIVSATFHGHEHILGWTHMDNTRVAGLTGSFEQFLTSPAAGGTYNEYLYPARMDYTYMNMDGSSAFATILVAGASFTVDLYKVGTSAPVWSQTFTNDHHPTPTFTFTPSDTLTATFTPSETPTATFTPSNTLTITYTPLPTNTGTPTSTITETNTFTPTPTKTSTLTATSTAPQLTPSTPTPTVSNTPFQTPTRSSPLVTLYLPLVMKW
jgi:hypothetical protein